MDYLVRTMLFWVVAALWTPSALAQGRTDVAEAATRLFDRMPVVTRVDRIAGECGADSRVNTVAAYCTSDNTIFFAPSGHDDGLANYLLAHVFGHAVQVQHGVADVALREITRRPADEVVLRGYVERQVDCIAGVLLAEAGLDLPDMLDQLTADPLDQPHWGRRPLHRGPHLPVPIAERAYWLGQGHQQGLAGCAVGEFGPELLLAARNR